MFAGAFSAKKNALRVDSRVPKTRLNTKAIRGLTMKRCILPGGRLRASQEYRIDISVLSAA
jgi:hypothetical protein